MNNLIQLRSQENVDMLNQNELMEDIEMLNQIRSRSCGVEGLGRWVAPVDNLRIGGL